MFEFYERVSGARMHAAYVRPGGVHQVSLSPCLPDLRPAPLSPVATGGQRGLMGPLTLYVGGGEAESRSLLFSIWLLGPTSWTSG